MVSYTERVTIDNQPIKPERVVHGGHRGRRGVDRVVERIVEELLDEPVHAVVQGGGEEHALAAGRGGAQNRLREIPGKIPVLRLFADGAR